MSLSRKSKGSQVNTCSSFTQQQLNKSGEIYSKRKDINQIKANLQKLVSSQEYWSTLAKFIHGGCSKQNFDEAMATYLPNHKSRKLHNELIRAILFNAHFSAIPPPEYANFDRKQIITKDRKQRQILNASPNIGEMRSYHSLSSADLRHIPTIIQLSSRLSQTKNIQVDDDALTLLFLELKKYILTILQQSVSLSNKSFMNSNTTIILPATVLHVIKMNPNLSSILTPSTISKFQLSST